MGLSNYLSLCVFHHTLGTCTHSALSGLETSLQPAAFMGFQSPATLSLSGSTLTFVHDIPLLSTAICVKGFLPAEHSDTVCSSRFLSLQHLAEGSLLLGSSGLLRNFHAILFPIHQQMLTASFLFSRSSNHQPYSLYAEIISMQANQQGARALCI